jgi:ankyrin repeat protein
MNSVGMSMDMLAFLDASHLNVTDPRYQDRLQRIGGGLEVRNAFGWTPLMCAVRLGRPHQCIRLIELGADVDTADLEGTTALMYCASSQDRLPLAEMLLELGADPNLKNKQGHFALLFATSNNLYHMTELLLVYGAWVDHRDDHSTPITIEDGDSTRVWGSTSLMNISHDTHVEITKLLLSYGARPNLRDRYGGTAIHKATECGREDICLMLIEAGADVDARDVLTTTPLMIAIQKGHVGCVRILLEAGADVDMRDAITTTPLMIAIRKGNVECVRILLEAGASPIIRDCLGDGPIVRAIRARHVDIFDLLLEKGASIDVTAKPNDQTLLMLAVGCNCMEIARRLCEMGVDVNAQDADGYSALLYVSRNSARCTEEEILGWCKLLVEQGAKTRLENGKRVEYFIFPQTVEAYLARQPARECTLALCSIYLPNRGSHAKIRVLPIDLMRTIFAMLSERHLFDAD